MVAQRLDVRLDDERRRRLAEVALARGAHISEVVRELIDQAYEATVRTTRIEAAGRIAEMQLEDVPDAETLCAVTSDHYFDLVGPIQLLDPADLAGWRERVEN